MLQTCMFRSTSPPGHCDKAGSGYHSFPENGNLYSAEYCKRHPSHPPAQGRAFPHASFSHRSDPPRTPTSMRRPFTRANLTGGSQACLSIPQEYFPVVRHPQTAEALAYQDISTTLSGTILPYSPMRTSNPRSLQSSKVQ